MEWLPIENAPRDGTLILTVSDGELHTARWIETPGVLRADGSGFFTWSGWQMHRLHGAGAKSFNPTHWMPLPASPLKEGK